MKAVLCISNKIINVSPTVMNAYVDDEGVRYEQVELDFQSLSLFTDKELRDELKRREDQKNLEAGKIRRCRHCVYCEIKPDRCYGNICLMRKYGPNNKHYTVNLSDRACELFEPLVDDIK